MALWRTISFDPAVLQEAERRADGDLSAYVNAAVEHALRCPAAGHGPAGQPPPLERLRSEYLAAMLERDAARGRRAVDEARRAGVPVIDLYTEVLAPVLHEVGHRWAVDELSVADEHFASNATQALLASLALDPRPAPTAGLLAVVSCTPDELHALGAEMVADVLAREGWEVISLGASTPADDLAELVERECPDLVALSTSTAGRLPGVADAVRRLAGLDPRPHIAVGGGLFTAKAARVARELGADLVAPDLRVFIAQIRRQFPASPEPDAA